MPLRKWFITIYPHRSHKKGISSHQLAKDFEVTQKTAWFMLQGIRHTLEPESFEIITKRKSLLKLTGTRQRLSKDF